MPSGGQFNGQLDRLVIDEWSEFEFLQGYLG
jgi:hypothetical protein